MADLLSTKQKSDFQRPEGKDILKQTDSSFNLEQRLRRHNHDGVESIKLNDGVERIVASFETDEQNTLNLYVPFDLQIVRVRGRTIKAIAASDNGTIIVKDHNGDTMATLTATASTAIDTDLTVQKVNINNEIPKDSYYQLVIAKTTDGGKVLVSVEYQRF